MALDCPRTDLRWLALKNCCCNQRAFKGTKLTMHYARDHSVQDGLTQVLALNSAMLQTEDIAVVLKAVRIFEHVCLRKHCYCVPHPYFIDTRARLMMTPVSTVGTRKERQSDLSGFTLKI